MGIDGRGIDNRDHLDTSTQTYFYDGRVGKPYLHFHLYIIYDRPMPKQICWFVVYLEPHVDMVRR